MSKSSPGSPKRLFVSIFAGALAVSGVALAAPAGATADVTTDRAAGATRYGTAAAVATEAYPDGADNVVIATGQNFPDALSASGLAGSLDGPILLTLTDSLSDEAVAAIDDLGATNATIVGGTAAVSDDVQSALEDHGLTVDRIAGDDRYETAGAVADAIGSYDRAIVASGEVAADALSAGPIAADGPTPILLVQTDNVPPATADALSGVGEVVLVGGTARISDDTAAEVESDSADSDAERVAGLDRQATAHDVAEWEVANLGWAPDTALLAAPSAPNDDFSPDALVAGPLGGLRDAPVLILDAVCDLGDDPTGFLTDHADTIAEIIAIGGTAVICDDAIADAADEATPVETPVGEMDFTTDTPDTTILTFTRTAEGGSGIKAKTVNFTGLDPDGEYVVSLIPCATPDDTDDGDGYHGTGETNVMTDGGTVTFRDADDNGTDGVPDDYADNAGSTTDGSAEGHSTDYDIYIISTNGEPVGNYNYVDGVAPDEDGSLDVLVSNENWEDYGDCTFVAVWDDANGNLELDLNEDNTAAEDFAVTGALVWASHEAPNGEDSSYDIVWREGNTLYTDSSEGYFFVVRSNDQPTYNDEEFDLTVDEWLAAASLGDSFDFYDAGYSRSGSNSFDLYSDSTDAPSNVEASQGDLDGEDDGTDVQLTWDAPEGGVVDYYDIYRNGTYIDSTTEDETEYLDEDLADDDYSYRVLAISESDDSSDLSDPAVTITTVTTAVPGAPISVAAAHTDADSNGIISEGDTLIFVFNEFIDDPATDAQIFLYDDALADIGELINGTNATFVKFQDNKLLVVVGAGGPIMVLSNGDAQLDYAEGPTVVDNDTTLDTMGVTDLDEGLEWNVAGSTDKTV